jgi:hypothetical protein
VQFTDDDACELFWLLAGYATCELDHFDHWKLETRWRAVYVDISRYPIPRTSENAYDTIWPLPEKLAQSC